MNHAVPLIGPLIGPLIAALIALTPLMAAAQVPSQDEIVQAELLPGWQMQGGQHMAGLAFTLAPHWKTYWRSPGEAGIPPQFDWSGSTNVKSVMVHWPSPKVFHTNGMQTIGYHDALVLPLQVTAQDPGQPMHLQVHIDMGVCDEICMPAVIEVQGDLPAPGLRDGAIEAALRARPQTGAEAGLGRISCEIVPIADGLRLTARLQLAPLGAEETVAFEAADRAIWVAEAVTSREGGVLTSVTELVASGGLPFALDRSGLTVTVLGKGRAVEIQGCPAP